MSHNTLSLGRLLLLFIHEGVQLIVQPRVDGFVAHELVQLVVQRIVRSRRALVALLALAFALAWSGSRS